MLDDINIHIGFSRLMHTIEIDCIEEGGGIDPQKLLGYTIIDINNDGRMKLRKNMDYEWPIK